MVPSASAEVELAGTGVELDSMVMAVRTACIVILVEPSCVVLSDAVPALGAGDLLARVGPGQLEMVTVSTLLSIVRPAVLSRG